MPLERIPQHEALLRRWRWERVALLAPRVFGTVAGLAVLLLIALAAQPPTSALLLAVFGGLAAIWLAAALLVLCCLIRQPSAAALAKRADRALGLPDDLLSVSELAEAGRSPDWREAARDRTLRRLEGLDLKKAWPVAWSRPAVLSAVAAVLLTAAVGWLGGHLTFQARAMAAQQKAAQKERLAAADDVLKDWKEFAETTDDKDLKKLFTEAANLHEALQNKDPMAAMLEMNKLEERMAALQQTVDKESLAPQAASLAEALESFEGMGAMSAALRNQNFAAAADEADKLSQNLEKKPEGSSALRRDAATSEMLSNEAKSAAARGNQSLSNALSQMSQAASQSKQQGSVPNNQIAPPTKSLQNQFSQEANRQNRGRALSLSKEQMDALRRRLRGEDGLKPSSLPSLCKSCCNKPGGSKAGTAKGGDPHGAQTELAEAGVKENVSGMAGDGETEKTTTSSTSGSGVAASGGKPASFSEYAELSQKAVADENLPLAHRRVIQTYFERIRPVAETPKP